MPDSQIILGVDEAGRGALAGPVVAAAVILKPAVKTLFFDSKTLTATTREELFAVLQTDALFIGVGIISHKIIDQINILQATLRAMQKAILQCPLQPGLILIDGNKAPHLPDYQVRTVVKGDQKHQEIAAASIIAKVTRDRLMTKLAQAFPAYQFEQHKGYATADHYAAIMQHGASPIHRRSFNLTQQLLLF